MRVVVTGAGGFVGRALTGLLRSEHDVVATDHDLPDGSGIAGDIADPATLQRVLAGGCDAVIHLATVPGAAAERDPVLARRINIDATMTLIDAVAGAGRQPLFVFASTIAVLGDSLPARCDDHTQLAPRMLYGGHKTMIEQWIALQTRREAIRGLSLRLPGIVARPRGDASMKSAFLSDVFDSLRNDREFIAPVSGDATMWLMSLDRVCRNLTHALTIEPWGQAVNLPALRVRFSELVGEIARQTGRPRHLVSHSPDTATQAAFGSYPPLSTPAALALGFDADENLPTLVASALATMA